MYCIVFAVVCFLRNNLKLWGGKEYSQDTVNLKIVLNHKKTCWTWGRIFLTPALKRQSQVDLFVSKSNMLCTVSSRLAGDT